MWYSCMADINNSSITDPLHFDMVLKLNKTMVIWKLVSKCNLCVTDSQKIGKQRIHYFLVNLNSKRLLQKSK